MFPIYLEKTISKNEICGKSYPDPHIFRKNVGLIFLNGGLEIEI